MSEQLLAHRPAELDDLAQVSGFVRNADELFHSYPKGHWPLSVEQLASVWRERRNSTLALLDTRPAGFANFYQHERGHYCSLGNLMIAPWARGQGVARYLVGVMEQLARRDHEARELRISCFSDNAAGLLLYSDLGYQTRQIVERTRGNQRVALVLLFKPLTS